MTVPNQQPCPRRSPFMHHRAGSVRQSQHRRRRVFPWRATLPGPHPCMRRHLDRNGMATAGAAEPRPGPRIARRRHPHRHGAQRCARHPTDPGNRERQVSSSCRANRVPTQIRAPDKLRHGLQSTLDSGAQVCVTMSRVRRVCTCRSTPESFRGRSLSLSVAPPIKRVNLDSHRPTRNNATTSPSTRAMPLLPL